MFRYPRNKQNCNYVRKFVLNGNWNDNAMIRSKITQDLVKAGGGLAPRIEYARLSVNGQYFGFYSIEESIKADWGSCFGMDMDAEVEDYDTCQATAASDAQTLEEACLAAGECATVVAFPATCMPTGHNPAACRENGGLDDDCCAMLGSATCAAGHTFLHGEVPCAQGDWGQAFPTYCARQAPGIPVPTRFPDCSDASSCGLGCTFTPAVSRCVSRALAEDPIEVAKTTILKNDHGPGGTWPQSCGTRSCADGFERKEPSCKHCDNDFLMRNNPVDFPDCQCDNVPQLDALFQTVHTGDKAAVQAAVNMTSIFVYQASVTLTGNIDTGSHNYYMSKQPGQPWRIISVDPDWSWGAGYSCGRDATASNGLPCAQPDQNVCLSDGEPNCADATGCVNPWCCGQGGPTGGGDCAEGFSLMDSKVRQHIDVQYILLLLCCC